MSAILSFLAANKVLILGALLAVSEVLAQIPGIKANSIFQLIVGLLSKLNPSA